MADILYRILCDKLNLYAFAAMTLETAREITGLHGTSPNATVALGRTVTSAALLGATLKPGSGHSLSVKFSGSGPLKEVHVQADSEGHIRGFAAVPAPDLAEDIGKISFSKAIGAGLLTVTKNTGMKEPYTGVTPILAGDIAADLSYYLTVSEQVPSAVILGLTLDDTGGIASSGGILIQTFPDTDRTVVETVESRIKSMTRPLGDILLEGGDILDTVRSIFGEEITILGETALRYACPCSRDYLKQILGGFSPGEIEEMVRDDGGAEIVCTFCKNAYHFDTEELTAILDIIKNRTIQ